MPKVLNKRTDVIPPDAILVDRTTKWGNPYKVVKDGTRAEVIEMYRDFILASVSWRELDIKELHGKDLVCWCAPLPCHADVLLELANIKPTGESVV